MKSISSIILLIFLISCQKEEITEREYPRISTGNVTNITPEGAKFSAVITAGNPETITQHGFVWGLSDNLTVSRSEKIVISEDVTGNEYSYDITFALLPMKEYFVRSYVMAGEYIIYGNPVMFKSLGSQAPVIDDFEPKSAAWGDTITITGKNFSFQTVNNLVYFGKNGARPFFSSDKQIKVLVPDALSIEECSIYVETYGNRCTTDEAFNLITPAKIVSSDKSNVTWGDTLIVNGSFPVTGELGIFLPEIKALIIERSATSIKTVIPEDLTYSDSVSVRLMVNDHYMLAPFKLHMIKPFITNLQPASFGWGDTISINGLFNIKSGTTKFYFSGVQAEIIEFTREKLTCIVPLTTSHTCPFYASVGKLILGYQDTISLKGPIITKAIPNIAYPGQYVQLIGKYFKPGETLVNINNYDVYPTEVTPTSCQIYISDYITSGTTSIKLIVLQKSYSSSKLLTVVVPTITDFSPKECFYDDVITITGQGFNTEDLSVSIGGSEAEIIDASSTRITARVPYNVPGVSTIYVYSNSKAIWSQENLTITKPLITSISNENIKVGDIITINGVYFNPVSEYNEIHLGTEYCEIVSASINEIRFRVKSMLRGNYSLTLLTGGRPVIYTNPISFISPWRLQNSLIRDQIYGNAVMLNDALMVFGGVDNYYQRYSIQGGDHQSFPDGPLKNILNGVVFNLNGQIYYGLGYTYPNTYYQGFYRFEPDSRVLTKLTDFPGPGRRTPFYFSIEHKAYIGTGISDNLLFDDLWEYNSSTGVWTKKGPLPFVSLRSMSFVINNKGYILDGKAFWLYIPQTDSWTRMADFPGNGRYYSSGFVLNDMLYFGTGTEFLVSPVSYSQSINDFWKYDPSANNWERLPDVPINLYGGFGVTFNGKGYLGGGYQTNILEYDPSYE